MTNMSTPESSKPIVYLAGGFRSGWQKNVHDQLGRDYLILDPSAHGIADRDEYTKWDLDAIRQCDIVLAFMESTNPGGYSLALEVGYAHALGKTIVFVDEVEDERARYFDMVHSVASRIFTSLKDALNALHNPSSSYKTARLATATSKVMGSP